MSLVDQIREALERQRIESRDWHINDIKENRETAPYEYDIHSFEIGHTAGADSRTEIICKLVEALDKIHHEDLCAKRYNGNCDCPKGALADLKKELGVE